MGTMKKIEEFLCFDEWMKVYEIEGGYCVPDVIEGFLENGVKIPEVEVSEGVELDMQTLSGLTLSVEEFIGRYGMISYQGRELSYHMNGCEYAGRKIGFCLFEESDRIVMKTKDQNMELYEVYQDSKEAE